MNVLMSMVIVLGKNLALKIDVANLIFDIYVLQIRMKNDIFMENIFFTFMLNALFYQVLIIFLNNLLSYFKSLIISSRKI